MKLISKLPPRKNKKGHWVSWGIFICLFINCNKIVERHLSSGKVAKSCGCQRYSEDRNKKISLANKGKKRTDEQNIKRSEMFKGENHPMYGIKKEENPNFGKKRTEEQRKRISKSLIGLLIGINNPNWQGGISFEMYPKEFKEIRKIIYERDNYICQNANCMNTENLDCHHIDYDKQNNNPENLIILCKSCHMKTNGKNKRNFYTEFYQNIMNKKLIDILV